MRLSGDIARLQLPSLEDVPAIASISLLYVLVTVVETLLASTFSLPFLIGVELTSALPVPLALVAGPVALWGIPLGYVLGDVASSGVGTSTLVGAGAHLYVGYSAWKLARRFDLHVTESTRSVGSAGVVKRFFPVVGLSTAGGAAIVGWGSEIFHVAPFFFAASAALLEFLTLNVLSTLLILLLFGIADAGVTSSGVSRFQSGESTGRFSPRWVALLTFAWLVLGAVGSVGYRTYEKIPSDYFLSANQEFLLQLRRPELFGLGAGRLEVLLGAILLSALVGVLWGATDRREGTAP